MLGCAHENVYEHPCPKQNCLNLVVNWFAPISNIDNNIFFSPGDEAFIFLHASCELSVQFIFQSFHRLSRSGLKLCDKNERLESVYTFEFESHN